MEGIKNLEIIVTENDKMPYFEIKYKEEGTENYVSIYTGNDIFKGWIMAYYKGIDDFANWLVEQDILGNRCISDGEITDYGRVYAKKYKEQLKGIRRMIDMFRRKAE